MIGGNLCWIVLGVLSDSIALMIANAVFVAMNLRGIRKWQGEEADASAT
jgi:hypothetical protein